MEEWKDIPEYEGLYQASNYGRIRRLRILKGSVIFDGYVIVGLSRESTAKSLKIHRLVAKSFILNPNNKPCINHIDGNKMNNNINNLEWCTYSENMKHSFAMGFHKSGPRIKYKRFNDFQIRVIKKCTDLSCIELSKLFETHYSTIWRILKRKDDV